MSEKDARPEKPDEAFVWRALTTKFRDWAYEREWRVFTTLKESVWSDCAGSEIFFVDFGGDLVLKEVLLGAESDTRAKEIFNVVGPDVRVSHVRLANATFVLELADCVRL